MSGVIYIMYDYTEFKLKTANSLTILAEVIGTNNTASILFGDSDAANESLKAIIADRHIRQVALFNKTGGKIAGYIRENEPIPLIIMEIAENDTSFFMSNSLIIVKPVRFDNEVIGSVYINSDLDEYSERTFRLVKIIAILLSVSLLASLLLSLKMQKIISEPVLRLCGIMGMISESNDYSIRLNNTRKDEIGSLVEGFNVMLAKIGEQNSDIVKAREQALNSAKIKEQFLANMSHEIRTPMNAIIGLSGLLQDTKLSSQQSDFLNKISISAENLLRIINDILDFSKIESGKLEFEENGFDLHLFLTDIVNMMKIRIGKKQIVLRLVICESVPEFIIGDQVRLGQILMNLVGNSIKFTEHGSIILNVDTGSNGFTEKTKRIIEFTVSDTGIGIPEDMLDSIFTDFCQASSSTTRKYGGTGLGLSICRKLVEMQKGSISATSKYGEGSCFTVRLPFRIATEIPAVEKCDKPPVKTSDLDIIDNIRVLLVEDNEINQTLARSLLVKKNFIVDVANNGIEAIEKIKTGSYHIILMDLHMPEMDGIEATGYIRNRLEPPKCAVPIIALTAAAIKGEREKCIVAGMDDYISKPFKADELLNIIMKFITPSGIITN
ncbi:MAG: response regulator [Bacteroidetes bacterium]|nr:response regulator [Bacteroidota bacterium]